MENLHLFVALVSAIFGFCHGYEPVYGFEGAASTLTSGKTLHYYIRLNQCVQRTGRGYPEYAEPFGSHVTKWRIYNEMTALPYITFHEQIPVLNRGGKLEQLSRDIQIMNNGSVIVTSASYTPDYSLLVYMYTHECTLSTQVLPGNIDFKASTAQPIRLNSFTQIIDALEAGEYLHFNARTFLCPGGSVHGFSTLGGHIPNYELTYDSTGTIGDIKVFVQTTMHYSISNNWASVIDFTINRNNTVTILDTRNSLPNYIRIDEHVTECPLASGQSGGLFNVYV